MSQLLDIERLHPTTQALITNDLRRQTLLCMQGVLQQKAELEIKRGLFGAMLRQHAENRVHDEARPGWGSW